MIYGMLPGLVLQEYDVTVKRLWKMLNSAVWVPGEAAGAGRAAVYTRARPCVTTAGWKHKDIVFK